MKENIIFIILIIGLFFVFQNVANQVQSQMEFGCTKNAKDLDFPTGQRVYSPQFRLYGAVDSLRDDCSVLGIHWDNSHISQQGVSDYIKVPNNKTYLEISDFTNFPNPNRNQVGWGWEAGNTSYAPRLQEILNAKLQNYSSVTIDSNFTILYTTINYSLLGSWMNKYNLTIYNHTLSLKSFDDVKRNALFMSEYCSTYGYQGYDGKACYRLSNFDEKSKLPEDLCEDPKSEAVAKACIPIMEARYSK